MIPRISSSGGSTPSTSGSTRNLQSQNKKIPENIFFNFKGFKPGSDPCEEEVETWLGEHLPQAPPPPRAEGQDVRAGHETAVLGCQVAGGVEAVGVGEQFCEKA